MKVVLNKSTKIKGKGLVLAGVEVSVTADQKKQLEKDGFLGEVKKNINPTNEKEIKELVAKVTELEANQDGDTTELKAEIETLKAEAVEKDGTITSKNEEIETLKAEIETLKATKAK